MLKINCIYSLLLLVVLVGCSSEEIDYNVLSAEEVEILYNNNHPELLNLVCEKYFDSSTTTAEDQWIILGENGHQDEVDQKFYQYCKLVYDNGNRNSACLLKEYYKKQISENKQKFYDFIYYLQECDDEESIDNFINKDSAVVAITEIIRTLLSQDTPQGLDSLIQFFIKAEKTFALCEKDLQNIYETLSLIEESIVLCESDLEAINESALSLFTTQHHDLMKIVRDLKNNFAKRRSLAIKVKNNDISINILRDNTDNLEIDYGSMEEIYTIMQTVTDQINDKKQDTSAESDNIVSSFTLKKKLYLKKYAELAN